MRARRSRRDDEEAMNLCIYIHKYVCMYMYICMLSVYIHVPASTYTDTHTPLFKFYVLQDVREIERASERVNAKESERNRDDDDDDDKTSDSR